jgi:integrase
MAIYKRGKFWWYRFQFAGRTYQASTRLKNEAKARTVEATMRTNLALGVYGLQPIKPGPRFREYAESFLEYVANHSTVPATIVMYGKGLKHLLAYKPLADCRLNLIEESVIEGYIHFRRSTFAVATLNTDLRVLRRALNVARKKLKVMTVAPSISTLPGEHRRDFVLSYAQEAVYLATCADLLRDAAILMLDTGLRVGECVAVRWSDFNTDRTSLAAIDPERFSPRILGVSGRCRDMLTLRRAFFPDDAYVFPGRFPGTHIGKGTLQEMHVVARRDTRLEDGSELPAAFVIHSLRHTFGTRFGELEPNAFIIKAAMGHSDVAVSQIYVHPQQAAMESAFERLDAMNRLMRGEEAIHESPPAVSKKR